MNSNKQKNPNKAIKWHNTRS